MSWLMSWLGEGRRESRGSGNAGGGGGGGGERLICRREWLSSSAGWDGRGG